MPCSRCRATGHNSSTCNKHLLISKPTAQPISIPCPMCKTNGGLVGEQFNYPCMKCNASGFIVVQTTSSITH